MSASVALRSSPSLLRPLARTANEAGVFEHVVVIAGPSGSGKSTFMREWVEGRLPRDIADSLPKSSQRWLWITDKDILARGLAGVLRSARNSPGLVLHYDLMQAPKRGIRQYAEDPPLKTFLVLAGPLTIVTVLPSTRRLIRQYLERSHSIDQYDEWWFKHLWLKRVRRRIHLGVLALLGRPRKRLKPGQLKLLDLYETPGGLDVWIERWRTFLKGLTAVRDVRLLEIAPTPDGSGQPSFTILPPGRTERKPSRERRKGNGNA